MTANRKRAGAPPIRISAREDGDVLLETEDFDRFLRSQREVVRACEQQDRMIEKTTEFQEQVTWAVREIHVWCAEHPGIARCVWAPRYDDMLVAFIAAHEQPPPGLYEGMSNLYLKIFDRTGFRMHFMMFRASEAHGVSAFAHPDQQRVLYDAKGSRPSDDAARSRRAG